MKYFLKIAEGIDVMPLTIALQRQPELWNQHNYRKAAPGSPHTQMSDIWIRYNDITPYLAKGDLSDFNNEHDSVWYPAFYALPQIRPIVFWLMSRVEGERLGGVLITKIPPGGRIEKHVDKGWHVEYYDKFYVSLKSKPGANFHCGDEMICPNVGDVYLFDNKEEHWVENNSEDDRMTLIVCIRTHKVKR